MRIRTLWLSLLDVIRGHCSMAKGVAFAFGLMTLTVGVVMIFTVNNTLHPYHIVFGFIIAILALLKIHSVISDLLNKYRGWIDISCVAIVLYGGVMFFARIGTVQMSATFLIIYGGFIWWSWYLERYDDEQSKSNHTTSH